MMLNTLIIADVHAPYHHRDTLAFLKAIDYEYAIEQVKSAGDLTDNHFGSFHELEYGTLSAQEEWKRASRFCQELEEVFPEMIIVEGNHCKVTKRKAKAAMIPEDHLKSYNDIYGVGSGWEWKPYDYFDVGNGMKCLLTHSVGSGIAANAQKLSMCSVQGHHHSKFGVVYYADHANLRWHMSVGCLIDIHSPAFAYGSEAKLNRPVIGSGIILEGAPVLIPMTLTKSGRWDKRLVEI